MKQKTIGGSSSMYEDYDNLEPKVKKMELRIANCRGKKPVITDIKKARNLLQNVLIELNSSEGERAIRKCTSLLWDILENNK